jgi:SAM-dependent methyltransferase
MREEVKAFVASVALRLEPPGPVVEIGALQTPGQEGYADLRPLFPGRDYLGCDLVDGPGVDRIEDVRALSFADGSIGTLLAVDSLEHVADPQHAVAEMHRVLSPDGLAVVGTPFVFPIHHHPDFTRFTPEGMARLLSAFPAVAVFSVGDAQWPHTVVAVASKGSDADRFQAGIERVVRDWEATSPPEALVRFQPVESVFRRDQLFPAGVSIRRGAPREQLFECPVDDLARIDVRLGADGALPPGGVRLSLHPEHGDAAPVVDAAIPGRSLGEPRWMAFQFPPVPDSGGRRYLLRLRVEDPDVAVMSYEQQGGGLVFELYRRRALVPPVPTANGAGADPVLAHRLDGLTAQMRGLEREIGRLRALIEREQARPWWRRLARHIRRGRHSA